MTRVAVVVSGMRAGNQRLQPWRYFSEISAGLAARGLDVELISDVPVSEMAHPPGVAATRWPSTRRPLEDVRAHRPDVALWGISPLSAMHTRPGRWARRNIAVVGSPLYGPHQVLAHFKEFMSEPRTYAIPILNALVPVRTFSRYLSRSVDKTIVMATYSADLLQSASPGLRVAVVGPGRDGECAGVAPMSPTALVTFLYLGGAASIRGVDVLVRAFGRAARQTPNGKLVLLLRADLGRRPQAEKRLEKLVVELAIGDRVSIVKGVLEPSDLQARLRAADVIVLPFRLVPAEAPLSVLEAACAGKPLISTSTASIPELAAPGSILVRPGDIDGLEKALMELVLAPHRRTGLADAAVHHAMNYPSWARVTSKVLDVLER